MLSNVPAGREVGSAVPPGELDEIIRHIGCLLPAQGPISVFVHHNPLHALEHLPFEQAAKEAARLFGCEPFLTEDRYREELRRGRIRDSDVDAVLARALGARAQEPVIDPLSRFDLRRRILLFGVPTLSGAALAWTLEETSVLRELREDLSPDAREAHGLLGGAREGAEARYVTALWSACRRAAQRAPALPPHPHSPPIRPRDLLVAAAGIDIDDWVHPLLIRFTSAYLDQGLADWPMPDRERGMYACFVDLHRNRLARFCGAFGSELQSIARDEADLRRDGASSLRASLSDIGVHDTQWEPLLLAEALALRGFAGMVRQFEVRPDRVPACPVPARLVDFLAIRMLSLRAALRHAARQLSFDGDIESFLARLGDRLPPASAPSIDERAWPLFQVAQLAGLSAQGVDALSPESVGRVEQELRELDGVTRRELLHRAYERHLRHRFFDALVQHRPRQLGPPAYQAIFCIDEREESIRRQLEETDPDVETFGVAGFFGVAIYYRGAADAHARPLCPVAIRPRHFVAEVDSAEPSALRERWRRGWQRIGGLVDKNFHVGGRRARQGAVLFATLGVLWVIPLVLRVVFPWLRRGVAQLSGKTSSSRGRLALKHESTDPRPPAGDQAGFTTAEMADVVLSQLLPIGIRDRFAPLVLVLGHGSTSLNNPHESAHDCGACGGGRGGPNARAFALMANDPAVRALASERGLRIPPGTWFVGAERNTASNDVEFFDEDLVPEPLKALLRHAQESLDEARRREAHERCRRFESAALWLPPAAALLHVQARSSDLAQPRPEYGHATNAACFIGRRQRTRGLYLDRRAFLVSYDSEGDPRGELLAKLLAAVVPVVAGISLEYLFGYVDAVGYGSGTKLPHNVTGLVGVMDGAQSDLRTGLPWQMLEIHEPVRLSIVVEADAGLVHRLLRQDPDLKELVDDGWVSFAVLDPSSYALWEVDSTASHRYRPEHPLRVSRGPSRSHYEGRRGHLPFAAIVAGGGDGA